ncbi:hypothetical protein EDD15DRAFT_2401697 [Pisolithus albus]|nr:hypothetical protein EDD15DRAFT_2401697 [Pisolithus albus]
MFAGSRRCECEGNKVVLGLNFGIGRRNTPILGISPHTNSREGVDFILLDVETQYLREEGGGGSSFVGFGFSQHDLRGKLVQVFTQKRQIYPQIQRQLSTSVQSKDMKKITSPGEQTMMRKTSFGILHLKNDVFLRSTDVRAISSCANSTRGPSSPCNGGALKQGMEIKCNWDINPLELERDLPYAVL